jgi:hypothetical protein
MSTAYAAFNQPQFIPSEDRMPSKYEVAVIESSGARSTMKLRGHMTRESANEDRKSLVESYMRMGYRIVDGTSESEVMTLELPARESDLIGFMTPNQGKTVTLIIRPSGLIL